MENLREKMIDFRAKNNLSQSKAAKLAKVTLMTWGSVERGIQSPSKLTESKIIRVINGGEIGSESINQPD